ncbi:MAG: hypothetical protein IKM34_05420 [Clostridia bacterium]|nr:hypothetical protein [Clostridia bacterium]
MKMTHYIPLWIALSLLLLSVLVFSSCSDNIETTTTVSTAVTTPLATVPTPVTTTPKVTTTETPVTTNVPKTTQAPATEAEPEFVNAVFGGGPFVTGNKPVANIIKNSDFNTLMIWSVHVDEKTCDLYLNDILVVQNGELAKGFKTTTWNAFKNDCPNITRIEISVSAWGTKDFEKIKNIIRRDGTGKDTLLYRNFKCLIEATGADAVNFDDESLYEVEPMADFAEMCIDMGCKITFCPYSSMDFWYDLYLAIGKEHVDRIYVQFYDGGAGNNVINWVRKFGCDIIPGYWCLNGNEQPTKGKKTPEEVTRHLKDNINKVCGGFMWLFDEMMSNGTTNQYAAAIKEAGLTKEWK